LRGQSPADTLRLLYEQRRPDPTPRQDIPASATTTSWSRDDVQVG